jgi:hypothetical protein
MFGHLHSSKFETAFAKLHMLILEWFRVSNSLAINFEPDHLGLGATPVICCASSSVVIGEAP